MATAVELRVLVDADGRVSRVQMVPYTVRNDIMSRRLRASFDSAAVHAVRGWIFQPQVIHGHPVAAWTKVRVTFEDPGDTRIEAGRPVRPEIGPPPRIVQRIAPIYPKEATSACLNGEVGLTVWLNDRAVPQNVTIEWPFRVLDPSRAGLGALFDSAAVRAVRQWRYEWRKGDSLRNCRRTSVALLFVPEDTNLCIAERTAQVVGLVRDSATGEPIEFANVMVTGTRIGTQTDGLGGFFLVGVPEGVVDILCHAAGYERTRASVRVSRGSRSAVHFSVIRKSQEPRKVEP
jgi:hypothetical protein